MTVQVVSALVGIIAIILGRTMHAAGAGKNSASRVSSITKPARTLAEKRARDAEGGNARGPAVGTAASAATNIRMLRTSERSTFKRCNWQWYISYHRQLRDPAYNAPALVLGTIVHVALANYYLPGLKRGPHPAKTVASEYAAFVKEATKVGFRDDDGKWQDIGDLAVDMMEHYIQVYGKDSRWKVLVTEQEFQVPVFVPGTNTLWFYYVGTLDGIWQDRESDGKLFVADHKTTKDRPDRKLSYLQMDDQAGSYWTWGVDWIYAKKLLKPDQKLSGMMYNFMRKAVRDERPMNADGQYLNKDGTISKVQPTPYHERPIIWRDEIERQRQRTRVGIELNAMSLAAESGPDAIMKMPGQMNCPGCPVRDACELHETGGNWEGFLKQTTATWNPYEAHEIYISETA